VSEHDDINCDGMKRGANRGRRGVQAEENSGRRGEVTGSDVRDIVGDGDEKRGK
jgi:hypothetical protein